MVYNSTETPWAIAAQMYPKVVFCYCKILHILCSNAQVLYIEANYFWDSGVPQADDWDMLLINNLNQGWTTRLSIKTESY